MSASRSVRLLCDVHCAWSGDPPRYRLYVNDELFTERTFIWQDFYLEEAVQMEAPPGTYKLNYQLLDSESAELKIKNLRVDYGNAKVHKHLVVEILP